MNHASGSALSDDLSDDDLRALLAVPASVLDGILGTPAPATYAVHRADGRTAHHRLVTAIDRIRRETTEHPASTVAFAEDVQRLYQFLAPILRPWPALRTDSPEATDRQIRDEWRILFSPWPAVELDVAPVHRQDGAPPAPSRSRLGSISVPGRGGTVWTLEDLCSPAGMARIRGIARAGMHIYWRPAVGSPGAILVDDVTDADHPETPLWLRWAQPHAYIQTSKFKTQAIFVLPDALKAQGNELVAFLNRERGDEGVHAVNHWMRLTGCWNHKSAPWCVRLLATGQNVAMADGWLENEASRMAKSTAPSQAQEQAVSCSSAPCSSAPSQAQEHEQAGASSCRVPLPEPEEIKEDRNVAATRFLGCYLARHWGDAEGAWTALQRWNRRLAVVPGKILGKETGPMFMAELECVYRSILRADMQHHLERWRDSNAVEPARRLPVRSALAQAPASPQPVPAPKPNAVSERDPMMEMAIARLAKATRASLKTLDACLAAVTEDGRALQFVPEAMKTPDVCAVAVRNDGTALQFVPEKLRTPELCAATVRKDGRALEWVPEALKTPEMCLAAVRGGAWALKLVPDELKTPELCMEAVKASGWALWWVPEELKTEKLCLEAVRQDGLALKHVPERLKTSALCVVAVRGDRQALSYVPGCIRAGVRRDARKPTADEGPSGPRR